MPPNWVSRNSFHEPPRISEAGGAGRGAPRNCRVFRQPVLNGETLCVAVDPAVLTAEVHDAVYNRLDEPGRARGERVVRAKASGHLYGLVLTPKMKYWRDFTISSSRTRGQRYRNQPCAKRQRTRGQSDATYLVSSLKTPSQSSAGGFLMKSWHLFR